MEFPIEHADKLLFLYGIIRLQEYLIGSTRYGYATYRSDNPYIHLETGKNINNFYGNAWLCDLYVTAVLNSKSSFNGQEGNFKSIGPWSFVYSSEFVGDLDSFLEDVTHLWYKHQP